MARGTVYSAGASDVHHDSLCETASPKLADAVDHGMAGLPDVEDSSEKPLVIRIIFSLRFSLSLFCVIAIGMTAFVAWYPTYVAGLDSINSVTENFQVKLAPMIVDAIEVRLSRAERLVFINKCKFRKGLFTPNPSSFLAEFFIDVNSTLFCADMVLTSTNGGIYGHFHDPYDTYTSMWIFNETTGMQSEWFTNTEGDPVSLS
jgi:hypothetical protein